MAKEIFVLETYYNNNVVSKEETDDLEKAICAIVRTQKFFNDLGIEKVEMSVRVPFVGLCEYKTFYPM